MLTVGLYERKQKSLGLEYTYILTSKDLIKEIKLSLYSDTKFLPLIQSSDVWLSPVEKLLDKEVQRSRRLSYNIRRIGKVFSIENEKEFAQFVLKNSEMVSLLLEAQKQIRKYFQHEKLSLKVSSDYEYPEWEKLVLSICTDVKCSDEAFNKLSVLDETWWLEASSGIGLNLYIGLEFE
ncbi:hypothetical protein [Iningainema tapete]|uniref:Uncharacterized protein n=1 Tax=Iningainema tapete BLCC-T55 TaxID=2748662 RepID=A0A8J7CI83_9CYAN|nr:hypothetical protein [Iningainema tapete]MBD2778710.1 hypothetical protein [Iningainema tapete BLCC-T55]